MAERQFGRAPYLASPFCAAGYRGVGRASSLLLASLDLLVPLLLLGCVALQALVSLDPLAPRALKRLLRIGGLCRSRAEAVGSNDQSGRDQLCDAHRSLLTFRP